MIAPASLPAFLRRRHRVGLAAHGVFLLATCLGIVALLALLGSVVDGALGFVAVIDRVDPTTLTPDGRPLEALSQPELVAILQAKLSPGAYDKLDREQPFASRSRAGVLALVYERVVVRQVEASWPLSESLRRADEIRAEAAAAHPGSRLIFRSWLNADFLTSPMSSRPELAGVRTAVLGSLLLVALTLLFALPLGVGAAIYLQEYARPGWLTGLIQTNIYNLAGVPSIVYGMLGLAIFVRTLAPLTSGAVFGVADSNGRTVLSAALTMALLILPILIVNAQEALKAVPDSFRQAAFGLGATRWQTVWHHVLPNALPGILTGSILAVSRAIGETAPLVVIGASTFITVDPDGLFSKFTALPIQIFNWTTRPQPEFRAIAAAAILVLLVLLLALNAAAITLRNRFSRRLY